MRRIALSYFIIAFLSLSAQECPPEWIKYTLGEYLYDIQISRNSEGLSEIDFKSYLLDVARTNLAKQVKIRVQDEAELKKSSVNGYTMLKYNSQSKFSTDLNLKLVESRTYYDKTENIGYAITFIKRDEAINYYQNVLVITNNKIGNALRLADNYIATGFSPKAKSELELSLTYFVPIEEALLWLNIFGFPQSKLNDWQQLFNAKEQEIKKKIADLKYGTTICISCNTELLGEAYPMLLNELKGKLSPYGCNFTDDPSYAEWVITINCYAREYSNVKVGKTNTFFAYVNAQIAIDKVITSQRILKDEISVKKGHTFGYVEAAKVGYQEVSRKLSDIIINTLSL